MYLITIYIICMFSLPFMVILYVAIESIIYHKKLNKMKKTYPYIGKTPINLWFVESEIKAVVIKRLSPNWFAPGEISDENGIIKSTEHFQIGDEVIALKDKGGIYAEIYKDHEYKVTNLEYCPKCYELFVMVEGHTVSVLGECLSCGYKQILDGQVSFNTKDFKLKPKTKNMRKITWQQAQSIMDSACSEWKHKLALKWAYSIALRQEIVIDEEFYQQMRAACTFDQHKLFDTIFGSDKPKFKVGDWVYDIKGTYLSIRKRCLQVDEIDKNGDIWCKDLSGRSRSDPTSFSEVYRLATKDEIKQANWFEKSTLCLAQDLYQTVCVRWSYPNSYGYFYDAGLKTGSVHLRDKWIPCTPEQVEWYENLSK